ncbi:hypothetical protein QTG54_005652 [Skeletonema marinoi]|uniref:WRKY19-like zinc finger domain-containing protein n=1 Tax=Skeletonema marinoi TaxID=267567 RepID=A0AAD8YEM8_9STRA|nr:hypothetical protein QTG54_005652 [Skeletonema marinoi]
MDNSPPKNMTKRDFGFGLTDDNNYDYDKLTRQHVIQGAGSKENASPQKEVNEVNTGTFAPLGYTKAALFVSGGGSNNPSFCTLMNDVKDTSTSGEKASAEIEEGAVVSGGSHDQAARGYAPKEGDDDLFRDVKESVNATDTLMEKTTSDEYISIRGDNRRGRELDEVKSALSNHTSALLRLLRQTAAKGEKCVPASLVDPVREETMAALRNANCRFPLSGALSEAESDAVRLYTEEIRQRRKEEKQQQQSLETMNDDSSDEEGKYGTKSVLAMIVTIIMPTAIEALAKDGSGGGLTGELREHEHELCAFSYDSSDEPTEVIVLIKNEAGDESSKEDRAGVSKSIADALSNGSDSSSAPPVMDKSPSKNMTKRDFGFGLTDDNYDAKLTRQHVIQGAGSKENASPQKEVNEVNTRSFAPVGCTKKDHFVSGGGSNKNPSSRTLMNDVKDISTSGNIITTAEKAGAGIEEAVVSGGSHDQAARGNAPKEGGDDLFRDVKERGNATDTLMEKTTYDESISGDNRQGRELDEVKSALSNHTSALLMLLRQTAAKAEKCVPAVLLNPVREETMTALRNANFRFPLSSALSDAENDAVRLFTEEIRQRKKEKQQQQQRLETMNDESSDEEGQCETKSVLASASANKAGVTSKRPRSDKESENGQDNKRTKNQCMSEGCENNVIKGGVCWRHGAKAYVKLCSSEGCTNRAIQGGVCKRHGATKKLCSRDGCTKQAKKGGVCIRHGRNDLA